MRLSTRRAVARQGLILGSLLAVFSLGPAQTVFAYCGGPNATITSLTASAPDDEGNVLISIAYDANTQDMFWRWNNGPITRELIYERQNVPNPIVVSVNPSCFINPAPFEVTVTNCAHGGGESSQSIMVSPPASVAVISNLSITRPATSGNVSNLRFEYELTGSGGYGGSRSLRAFILATKARIARILVKLPDIYGNQAAIRGTVEMMKALEHVR